MSLAEFKQSLDRCQDRIKEGCKSVAEEILQRSYNQAKYYIYEWYSHFAPAISNEWLEYVKAAMEYGVKIKGSIYKPSYDVLFGLRWRTDELLRHMNTDLIMDQDTIQAILLNDSVIAKSIAFGGMRHIKKPPIYDTTGVRRLVVSQEPHVRIPHPGIDIRVNMPKRPFLTPSLIDTYYANTPHLAEWWWSGYQRS